MSRNKSFRRMGERRQPASVMPADRPAATEFAHQLLGIAEQQHALLADTYAVATQTLRAMQGLVSTCQSGGIVSTAELAVLAARIPEALANLAATAAAQAVNGQKLRHMRTEVRR